MQDEKHFVEHFEKISDLGIRYISAWLAAKSIEWPTLPNSSESISEKQCVNSIIPL